MLQTGLAAVEFAGEVEDEVEVAVADFGCSPSGPWSAHSNPWVGSLEDDSQVGICLQPWEHNQIVVRLCSLVEVLDYGEIPYFGS